ncbi:MAG: glycoside hydrolase [Oscillospiraceae bacterium]|nr:glycoside hydrolase [Oscillospiraceae bacterium]
MARKHILIAVGSVVCAGLLASCAVLGAVAYKQRHTIASLRESMERQGEDPDLIDVPPKTYEPVEVDHFYERRGHKILLSDDKFGQIWLPVLADVPLSTHPVEHMVETDQGRMLSFDDAGNLNALTGIDISSHNIISDWTAVKEDGIDFVMLRVGYRGYGVGTGKLSKDTKFREYYRAAKDAGLLVGAYFFSQAVTEEEAVEEAILTAQQLEGCELDFPVAFDWELIFHDDDGARTDNVPVDVLTDCVLAYCQNMESFGYRAMVYQNKRTSLFKFDLPRLNDIPFWLAEYGDGPTYIYDYDMWQYSCTGTVEGISGNVDLNLCFKDFSKEGDPLISLPAPDYTPMPPKEESSEEESSEEESEDSEESSEDSDESSEEAPAEEQPAEESEQEEPEVTEPPADSESEPQQEDEQPADS